MNQSKKVCPKCGREITPNNYQKHVNSCKGKIIARYKLNHEGLECQFCGKVCNSRNSLCNHERLCKSNPNKQVSGFIKLKGKINSLKGKTAENCESIRKQKETFQKNKLLGKHNPSHRKHSVEEKKHLSELAIKNNLGGFNMRKVKIIVNGIRVDSSYEEIVANDLIKNNIRWERGRRFTYHSPDGNIHRYTPDFYLPDYDVYLDPKNDFLIHNPNPRTGYKDLDKIKWVMNENNIKVIVLSKDNLTWNKISKLL